VRIAPAWLCLVVIAGLPGASDGQTLASEDPVLRAIWGEAMDRSLMGPLAQTLLDSIGPRLTASPGMERAQDWAVRTLRGWGVDARLEQYGTWEGWERGAGHIDLVGPRVRALDGRLLAWSPGTEGRPLEGRVIVIPTLASRTDWEAFLSTVRGAWVMVSYAQPTCRPDDQWVRFQQPGSGQRMAAARQEGARELMQSLRVASEDGTMVSIHRALEAAGALGVVTSDWQGYPGANRVMDAYNRGTPPLELSWEDYGLVYRLASSGHGARLRLTSDASALGEVPVYNVIGEVRGSELPDEYVVLSAHFDSWDGASGATDNGAGVLLMMEALRVLTEAYPNPRRTLLLTLWSGEEQGLLGSGAWAEDHPEILEGVQAVFNQDSGTGRVARISSQGFVDGGAALGRWLASVPSEVRENVETEVPGAPSGGSDYGSFVCRGAPSFPLGSLDWDYSAYTWHSDEDTFDKLVFDDLRDNVVLTASLAYLASEDDRVGRGRRELDPGPDGTPGEWPACRPVLRQSTR
jgi:carboxypeptidase Q